MTWERSGLRLHGEDGRRSVFAINYRQTHELGALVHAFHEAAFGRAPDFVVQDVLHGPRPRFCVASELDALMWPRPWT